MIQEYKKNCLSSFVNIVLGVRGDYAQIVPLKITIVVVVNDSLMTI